MNILAIDTSNHTLGVAILKNDIVKAEHITNLRQGHAERLMPAIVQLMEDIQLTPDQLNKIVVAKGPGSYTGVRIGLTTAKTMAWTLNIPLVGVSSIESLAYQGRLFPQYISPFFDARRGRIYTGLYTFAKGKLQVIKDERNIAMDEWLENISPLEEQILFLSPHLDVFQEQIIEQLGARAVFVEKSFNINRPSHIALAHRHQSSESVHTLVPNYLRLTEAEAQLINKEQG